MAAIPVRMCLSEADLTDATGYDADGLWQFFSLDDWDYALVVDKAAWESQYVDLERWLFGPCDNEVHELPRKDGAGTWLVGVAYHA